VNKSNQKTSGIVGIYVRSSVDKENTSIDSQINMGINFCKKNNFQYQIYEDIGKSGFKIDDENNPFKNRKGLLKLISDIENKVIDKIWVFENSRLSRNEISSFTLNRIFQKNNIILYENGKQYDFNNPQNKMIQGILSQISQYERHLIINRTIRGVQDIINRGIHSFNELYGYKRNGTNNIILSGKEKSFINWEPIDSEIKHIKYSFKKVLEGHSVSQIVNDIFKKKLTEKNRSSFIRKFGSILRQFVYTGYCLNIEGQELYRKFKNFEIDSIKELNNKKYYVKSISYPVNIVSIENWIKVVEKLQGKRIIYKDKMRRTNSEMLTGIMSCPYCELRYYLTKDNGYLYYKHFPKKLCGQKPKSVKVEKLNQFFDIFFFYYYLIYDNTNILMKESLKILDLNLSEIKDRIKSIIDINKRYENQINKIQSVYDNSDDKETIKLSLKKENDLTNKIEENKLILLQLNNEFENLKIKNNYRYSEFTEKNVKELIINFFDNMNNEDKRIELLKIIKNCQLFGKFIIINTGNLLFIFHIDNECILTEKIYNIFKRNKNYKDNILKIKDIYIQEYYMENKYNSKIRIIMKNRFKEFGIKYDISNIDKIISFTDKIF